MVVPELRMLEIRSPEMQMQSERKRACMYAAESTRGDVHTDGKARAGGRGQGRRASGERLLLGGRGGGGRQHAQGSVQRESGVGRAGSAAQG